MPDSELQTRFAARLADAAATTQTMLEHLLQPEAQPGETTRPARLLDALRYACLDGGKRLRPFLLIETAALFGKSGIGVTRTAAALEMVHCYSLVHDDLPAMDNDDMRRGRPTVHRAYDEATAILVGDSLLTLAFDVLADSQTHALAEVRLALVQQLARAAGLGGMAGGQALDLGAEHSPTPLTLAAMAQLQAMKTGALIRFAVEAGAIIGGANAQMRAHLVAYATGLGAAFQIADDILDAEGDSGKLGKATAKDKARNKATLVQALGLTAAKLQRDRLVADALNALQQAGFGENADILVAAAYFVASREA